MRRFRRRSSKRRTWWSGGAGALEVVTPLAADFTEFTALLRPDELFERSPHGVTILRIVGEFFPWITIPTSSGSGVSFIFPFPWDVFLLARQSAADDAGVETWIAGTNILKPFVAPDLANVDLGATRQYMWTRRWYLQSNLPSANPAYQGVDAVSNYLPSYANYHALDLRVKRRLENGENLMLGCHFPTAFAYAGATFGVNYHLRILLAA